MRYSKLSNHTMIIATGVRFIAIVLNLFVFTELYMFYSNVTFSRNGKTKKKVNNLRVGWVPVLEEGTSTL